MKKSLTSFILLCMVCVCCVSCFYSRTEEKKGIVNYQYMYDGFLDVYNSTMTPDGKVDKLLGYGEYLYNSYLILFPRETPSTLTDYYFYWSEGIDADIYAIYFTCKLTESKFTDYLYGLNNFRINSSDTLVTPIYNEDNFSLPTYILQWLNVGEKWEVLEYVMVDAENNTIIFVYTMSSLERIQSYTHYDVTPYDYNFLESNFSIYGKLEDGDSYIRNDTFDESTYDISFIDNLK